MARARKKKKQYRYRSYQTSKWVEGLNLDLELEPHIVREVVAVLLIGLSAFTLLAIMGVAGNVGNVFFTALRLGLGWTSFVLPVILIGAGLALFYPVKYKFTATNTIGLILLVISLSALLHLFVPLYEGLFVAQSGAGGGYVGFGIAVGLVRLVDFWAALLIVAMALAISLLFVFGQPLRELYYRVRLNIPALPHVPKLIIHNAPHKGGKSPKDDDEEDKETNAPAKSPAGELEVDKGFVRKTISEPATEFIPQFVPSGDFKLPSVGLLSDTVTKVDSGNIRQNVSIIQESLEDFGIQVEMSEVNVGPTVTQYTLKPAAGVKLSRISNLSNDLSLALAAHPIRIEAPIPGRSLVGIELPNRAPEFVTFKKMLTSDAMHEKESKLAVALGLDVGGKPVVADIAKMPHVLIAGQTGSGKSVCLNAFLASILFRASPSEVKFILVDPKRVELTGYNDIPHMLTPVIVEPEKVISALRWILSEMERRYKIFAQAGVRNIDGYNQMSGFQALPYIVLVVDELADVMLFSPVEVEDSVTRIAQMSRATGIHMILATQRPSVDVITGLIKANIPCRVAFAVASQVDSRVILDSQGAEKLLGKGDMLYLPPEQAKPMRIQGAFTNDKEIKDLVEFLKRQGVTPQYTEEVVSMAKPGVTTVPGVEGEMDDLFRQAVELVCQFDKASASLLQRRLSIGYARAARILDQLEAARVVGPADGSKPREVLVQSVDDIFGAPE